MWYEFVVTFDYLNIRIKIAGQDQNQDCSTFSPVIVDNCYGDNTIVKLIIKCTIVFLYYLEALKYSKLKL